MGVSQGVGGSVGYIGCATMIEYSGMRQQKKRK